MHRNYNTSPGAGYEERRQTRSWSARGGVMHVSRQRATRTAVAVLVMLVTMMFAIVRGGSDARAADYAQVLVTLVLPTATRTPTPINVGNFVWNDLDADGRQDAGEPGLSGVTVQLWNSTKTTLIASTFTNANGNYTLVAPTPGDYRIRVLSGIGAGFAPKDNAIDDTDDSNCNSVGVSIGFSDVFSLASNIISITSKDCGLIGPYSTATPTPLGTPTATGTPTFEPDLTETVIVVEQDSHQYLPIALC
jgi:hypothetical protein